jgi:osmotically-inducible protein OsmY
MAAAFAARMIDVTSRGSAPIGWVEWKERELSNDELTRSVTDELVWDPKVNGTSVAVAADDGTVTLRGTVGSFREKREAGKAAERIHGVTAVKNELKVRLMTEGARSDADIRGDVLQALMLDTLVPSTIDAQVNDGEVALTGEAEWRFQRDEAMQVAGNIRGVVEVWDEVVIVGPPPDAADVKDAIAKAFDRSAKLDAEALTVETSNGTVTVKGTVQSWAEHDEAIDAAWAAPGVREVDDRILVLY